VVSLTVDGVVAGVGAVLTFIPQIVMLFIFITFLEGCGYMARVAVIMDRLFKRLGLSGKSFIPMIVGCGCSVPAILSAKTVDGEKEKRNTILLTPFIPCSAKLPVFALFAGALFPENAFVAPGMYFLGIFMVVIGALFLKIFNRGERNREMLIIELPHYRLPAARNVVREIWDKTRGFIVRAGVIIVPAAIVLWVLQSFSFSFRPTGVDQSMLAQIGRVFAWILVPLGFGNWQSAIAYLSGIVAKETVVATYGVVLGGDVAAGLATIFTPTSAFAFMAFTLLSAPCIAAIAATKNELGVRGMWIAILFQCGTAWVVAFLINQFGNLVAFHRTAAISAVAIAAIIAVFAVAIWYFVRKKSPCGGGCGNCRKKNDCENEKK
jgi:ferrous iron transport protein B